MDWMQVGGIVTGIILVMLTKWGVCKLWAHIPREIGEALVALADYLEDPNPSEGKRKKLIDEFGDVISLVRSIFWK